jgi:hypothetical protein
MIIFTLVESTIPCHPSKISTLFLILSGLYCDSQQLIRIEIMLIFNDNCMHM